MTETAGRGITRREIDAVEASDLAPGAPPLRPRDAATLILLERRGGEVRVLMGRRHLRHAFMPGKFVFPGGRTDPDDGLVEPATPLPPADECRLAHGLRTARRARAIALSAVRETYEEAGLLIGQRGPFACGRPAWQGFVEHGVRPSLDGLRYVARAITPPGRVRRFDTRFLAAWRDAVAAELPGGGISGELEELVWLPLAETAMLDLPYITGRVIADLASRLERDPELDPGGPVPFYRMVRKRFGRDVL